MRCICAVGKNNRDTRQGGIGDKGSKSGVGGGRGVGGGYRWIIPVSSPQGGSTIPYALLSTGPSLRDLPTYCCRCTWLGERAIQVSSSWSCRQTVRIWVQTIVRKIFVYVHCLWYSCNCVLGVLYCHRLYTCPRCIHVLYCTVPRELWGDSLTHWRQLCQSKLDMGRFYFFNVCPFKLFQGTAFNQ